MPDSDFAPSTPYDVRLGLTKAEDVAFPLRWGILGSGNISAQWVMSLNACEGASVTAVAARELSRAQAFADRFSIGNAYDSYEQLATSDDVDIIYVGTITRLHKEHSLLALNAGKHVLCEKPLAENSDDAREMYAAAKANDVMLQDAMWTRFFPAVEHARHAIETGMIGDVTLVQADFGDPIYTIQAVPLAFGKEDSPVKVTAAGMGAGAAILEYSGGRLAVLTFPNWATEFGETTYIAGTKGSLFLGRPGHCPTQLTIRVPPAVPSEYRTNGQPSPAERFEYPLPWGVSIPRPFPNQHGFLYQAEAVHRCLAAGLKTCPQYDEVDSLHAMDLLTAITKARQESAQT